MSYQKCPICDGSGTTGDNHVVCTTCEGRKIIHETFGTPPGHTLTQSPVKEFFIEMEKLLQARIKPIKDTLT